MVLMVFIFMRLLSFGVNIGVECVIFFSMLIGSLVMCDIDGRFIIFGLVFGIVSSVCVVSVVVMNVLVVVWLYSMLIVWCLVRFVCIRYFVRCDSFLFRLSSLLCLFICWLLLLISMRIGVLLLCVIVLSMYDVSVSVLLMLNGRWLVMLIMLMCVLVNVVWFVSKLFLCVIEWLVGNSEFSILLSVMLGFL